MPTCSAGQVRTLAALAVSSAARVKSRADDTQPCALCGEAAATHTLLPCACTSVCEPCGKLKIFRYDLPLTRVQDLDTAARCPGCHAPAECMIALRKQERRVHFSIKLRDGVSITID